MIIRPTMTDEDEEILHNLIIPDHTQMEEHTIATVGDVIIGNRVSLGYGIIADSITIGEHSNIEGNIIARSDLRVDFWTKINGSVQTDDDAYFGEFVNISGKLTVDGNLDVGNNVRIKEGYTAKGWIIVRNPLPVLTYIFLYLVTLFQLDRGSEEIEKALDHLFSEEEQVLSMNMLTIPDHAIISLTDMIVHGVTIICDDCRLFGNIKTRSLCMGDRNDLFGSIRTDQDMHIGTGCIIHGALESKTEISILRGTRIMGDVDADKIIFHETACIDGNIRAPGGVITIKDDVDEIADDMLSTYYCFSLLFPHSI